MNIDKKAVRGWVEPTLTVNPEWRWWSIWRDRFVTSKQFIPDKDGDVLQEMTVVDFEGVTMADGYSELVSLARAGRVVT